MLHCMLKNSQIQDVLTILREVLRTLRTKTKIQFHTYILDFTSALLWLLWDCWRTNSSSFPFTQISPQEPLNKWVTSTLSYEFSLHKQKILCPSLMNRQNVMKCLISWGSVKNRLGWQVQAGEGTVISPRRPDRQGQLCSHCERNKQYIRMLTCWTRAHTYLYSSLLLCFHLCSHMRFKQNSSSFEILINMGC